DRHDAADGEEVEPDDFVDVLVLHLYRDVRAVFQPCFVNLAERCARDGRLLELVEERSDAPTELRLDAGGDLGVRTWRYLVLERLQPGAELRRQEVRHDREQLPNLDEEALELHDRSLDAACVARVDVGDVVVYPGCPEEAAQGVKPEIAAENDERSPV